MNILLKIFSQNKLVFIIAALMGLFSGAVNAKLISLVSEEIAAVTSGEAGSAGMFVMLIVVAFLCGAFTQIFMSHLSARLTYNLRMHICRQILDMPYHRQEEIGSSRLLAAFTDDIRAVGQALLRLPNVFVNSAVTLGCLIYLAFLSPSILGFLIAFLFLAMLSYRLPEKIAVKFMRTGREQWDHLLAQLTAIINGRKELALHQARRTAMLDDMVQPTAHALRNANYAERAIYAFLTNWSRLIYFVFLGLLVYVAPKYLTLTMETLIGFTLVVLYIRTPIIILVEGIPVLRRAGVAFEKITKLGMFPDVENYHTAQTDAAIAAPQPLQSIQLQGVTHTFYREKEEGFFKLGPLNFEFKAGETVFIIGGNGSGKTTMAKLITGLYTPEEGAVLLNGKPVTPETLAQYRACFTAIFSDFYVFEQLLGLDDDEGLDLLAGDLLKKLHLDHKVSVSDGKLSTTKLSTGQRKRLALVTAYLEDRQIYLFDEWAADQDPEFKDVFYRVLLPELKARGKTLFVISHDDRWFDQADRLIKLADGAAEDVARQVQRETT